MNKLPSSQLGMTLLEVMLAFAIFAVAGLSILSTVTQNIRNISQLEERMFANIVADNQLTRLQMLGSFSGSTSGEENLAGTTWYWQAKSIAAQLSFVNAVDVSVSKNKDHSSPIVTVRTYVKP